MSHFQPTVKTASDSFSRPANTTTYTAKDAISDSTSAPTNLTFYVGKGILNGAKIRSVVLAKSGTGVTALGFRLYLFDTAPTAVEDNAAWDPTDAEIGTTLIAGIEFIDGDSDQNASTNVHWSKTNLDIPFKPDSTGNIYAHLVATGAYDPASAETFYVRLGVEVY